MSNEEVLVKIGAKQTLLATIRKRHLQFLGHVLRKQELEELALTGKIEGKRARGRQRLTFISILSCWMKTSELEILRAAKDRKVWKPMAVKVLTKQDT